MNLLQQEQSNCSQVYPVEQEVNKLLWTQGTWNQEKKKILIFKKYLTSMKDFSEAYWSCETLVINTQF